MSNPSITAVNQLLDPQATAARLPYGALVREIERLLCEGQIQVPPRMVLPLQGGASLFVMPACDRELAITKLITFTPANVGTSRATIQGDVVVFDVATGARRWVLDGPTVTARRTAAVSLLAAQYLAPQREGPLLIVGAGAQGRSHLEAFSEVMGVREVMIASGTAVSAERLADYARTLGVFATVITDLPAALRVCPLVVTATPASGVVLSGALRSDAFVAAVGAFKPSMVELDPALCRFVWDHGTVVVDTADAAHEAGDLLQAGIDVTRCATLQDVVRNRPRATHGPVLFKSCGWAGWDLAAARTASECL